MFYTRERKCRCYLVQQLRRKVKNLGSHHMAVSDRRFEHYMNQFFDNLERKLRGKAVPRLTAVMIGCFVLGYIMQLISPNAAAYMNLNIYQILHGQIWRVITWVIIPPDSVSIFTIIMLFFYFSIGTTLERTWGDERYNIYIFGGMLISIAAAFIAYVIFSAFYPGIIVGAATGAFFSTYNICVSILLAYSATFPDAMVLLMFVIPLKMKYLGWIYGAYIIYDCITYIRAAVSGQPIYWIYVIAIGAAMLNFLIFYLSIQQRRRLSPEEKRRQREFRRSVEAANKGYTGPKTKAAGAEKRGATIIEMPGVRHRCEICGRTEVSDPNLEFRYCSKCAGDHEYCMDHLYTHQHITISPKQ